MKIKIELLCDTPAEAADALQRLTNGLDYADRPDVGKDDSHTGVVTPAVAAVVPAPSFAVDPAAVFGAAPPSPITSVPAVPAAPVPPAPAPSPVVPPAPVAPTGPELDAAGMPYDPRIHSGTKAKIADGTWRKKRGVDDAVVAQVEQQLRNALAAPAAAPVAPVAPAAPPAPAPVVPAPAPAPVVPAPAPAPAPVAAAPVAPAAPIAPAVPPAPVAPAAPANGGLSAFGAFMGSIAPHLAVQANALKLSQALQAAGLSTPADLAQRPDLIASVKATFDALLAG